MLQSEKDRKIVNAIIKLAHNIGLECSGRRRRVQGAV